MKLLVRTSENTGVELGLLGGLLLACAWVVAVVIYAVALAIAVVIWVARKLYEWWEGRDAPPANT